VGIQTVAFDVLFSREMNPEVAPTLSFAGPVTSTVYTGFYGGAWPAPNRYRVLYDFSTSVPRGAYTLTVQGAAGTDGIRITPHSSTAFTVDYAGYINDTTPPPAPTVAACAAATPDTLSARWSASDPESAIDRYQYAIGLTPGGAEVVNWTFTPLTEATRTGLTLIAGQTYYVSVKARNEGGLWSVAGSVGVVAGSGTCASTEPAPQADFTASPRSGVAPLTVQFTSVVTGAVTSYAWDFGDGGAGSEPNPTHTYQSAGSFGVTLVVTGPGGTAQVVKPGYITVSPPPDTAHQVYLPLVLRNR
jgi:PKD repeat protein